MHALKSKTYEEIHGKEKSETLKKKRSEWALRNPVPQWAWAKIGLKQKGIPKPKLSVALKGRKLSESHRLNIIAAVKRRYSDPVERLKNSITMKKKWQDKDYIAKVLNGLANQQKHVPSSYEKMIIQLCQKYELPFRYVGNGVLWVTSFGRHMNPDFVHFSKKLFIEVYHGYYKKPNYEKERKLILGSIGYDVIFLDDSDLDRKDWEIHCLPILEAYAKA